MRRFLVAAAVVAVGLVLGSVVPVSSQPPGQRTTITTFDPNKVEFEKEVNIGSKRFGPGDLSVFKEAQFDPESCERAGVLWGRIQLIKTTRRNGVFTGDFTMVLPDGKIVASGVAKFTDFENPDDPIFAVTGGTGAYRDATGQVFLEEEVEMCDKRGSLVTLDLSLD